jgi:hypothetical protein
MVAAMKVTGPGHGQGPESSGPAPGTDATAPKAEAAGDSETFAEKLQAGEPSASVDAAATRVDG